MKFYKMATMIGGVLERENTIEANRQVLSVLLGKNEFVEPSYKELNKLFTRLNAHNARKLVKDMKSYEADWHEQKVTDRRYGPIPGIPCGSWWGIRMDCSRDRMHDPFSASVQSGPVGAISICTSHSSEDVDLGDVLTFTGLSCTDEDKNFEKLIGETERYLGSSKSLVLNFHNQVPVRIIRSYDISNEYSPKTGYRYDGLYMVVDYWIGISPKTGSRCYKFALKRLFHQEPPPWKLKKPREDSESSTVSQEFSKNYSQGKTGTVSLRTNAGTNSNDTITSRCISSKRLQTRDGNMLGVVKSPCKRRPIRHTDTSLELEAVQSTSRSLAPTITTMLPVSPGRKIVSTDHRNVHVSAILTRRVSKKHLNNSSMEMKSPTECTVNKSWSLIGGTESQVMNKEGENEGVNKSQNTRLQITNISIRTDLYDSSHNLKYNSKKCASNAAQGPGIFKPRILGVPIRELNFAGNDSLPGSSRTVSSVKMERVQPIDTQINKSNFNPHVHQEKERDKTANFAADIVKIENTVRENQTTKDMVKYSPIPRNLSSPIDRGGGENSGSVPSQNLESRCLHSLEHSYASESTGLLPQRESGQDKVSKGINCIEDLEEEAELSSVSSEDDEDTQISGTEIAGSSVTALKNPEPSRTEEKSLGEYFPSVNSPSQSPFKGFRHSERSRSWTESSLSESSIMLNSLTFEKILDIITEDKSSPLAKMLISNVIGYPNVGSRTVFDETIKTTLMQRAQPSPRKPEITSTTPPDRGKISKWNRSRHSRPLENSREQKIIEIVYDGEDEDSSQVLVDKRCSSLSPEDESSIASSKNIEVKQKTDDVCLRLGDNGKSVEDQCSLEEKSRVLRTEDAVDFQNSKSIKSIGGHFDVQEDHERARTKAKKDPNSSKTHHTILKKGELLNPDIQGLSKSLANQNTNEILGAKPPAAPRIITRSKCLQNLIREGDTNLETLEQPAVDLNLTVNIVRNGDADCNQNLKELQMLGEEIVDRSSIILGHQSTGRIDQSVDTREDKAPNDIPAGFEDEHSSPKDAVSGENQKSKLEGGRRRLSKEKSVEKMRLVKRSGVKMKRKLEVANLFIDMNMSPRSQKLKVESRSRRSLRGVNHSRRRSCLAAVDRAIKRRSEDPVKHPTSPLKRMKKSVQVKVQSSSVQGAAKKGLSLRNRTKNGASPSRNNIIINNNDPSDRSDSLKRIGKAEEAMNKITKPIERSTQNLVAKKNTVNGLRAAAEISKRSENMTRTRSGINLRNLTVGRLGLRRALLPGIEAYARKKKKKKEKQKQKQVVEKMEKQTSLPAKQSQPERELVEFALKKANLDYSAYNKTKAKDSEKPKMVSVMTQCSLIPVPPPCSAAIVGSYCDKANIKPNSCGNARYLRGSDIGSECVCSSHNSPTEEIKNESIELIEIKSEAVDDDVANCDDGDDETEEIRSHTNVDHASNQALALLKEHKSSRASDESSIESSEVRSKNCTPCLKRFTRHFGAFSAQESRDSVPRRGFLPYVAVRRVSVFVPVRSVEGDLRTAQLKSIGFRPIKPGEFPQDGSDEGSEYGRRSTSDSPRIAYSSGVVKRGVNEEYDRYTSEETNVVQYMDSRLCYEDIENEDISLYGRYGRRRESSNDLFSQKMEFVKFGGRDIDEESNDNSPLREKDSEEQGGKEEDEEDGGEEPDDFEENEEYVTKELYKDDTKDWQLQLDDSSSSISEDTEQAVADSDGDVPWHGWKKITSNKETYFVGW